MANPVQMTVFLWTDITNNDKVETFDNFTYGDAEHTLVKKEEVLAELIDMLGEDVENDYFIDKIISEVNTLPDDALICFNG